MAFALFDREISMQQATRRRASAVSKHQRSYKSTMVEAERGHFQKVFVTGKGANALDGALKEIAAAELMATRLLAQA